MGTRTASRKLYEEMRPASNSKGITNPKGIINPKGNTEHRENVRLEDVKSHEKSTSRVSVPINQAETHVATTKILRQAMSKENPRKHSRIEQLKILMNEKMIKSQHHSMYRE